MAVQAAKFNFSWAVVLMLFIQSPCRPGLLLPLALLTVGLCDTGKCHAETPALHELPWLLGPVVIVLMQCLTCINWPFWETTCSCPADSVLTCLFCLYPSHYLKCLLLSHRKILLYQLYPSHRLRPWVLWEMVSVTILQIWIKNNSPSLFISEHFWPADILAHVLLAYLKLWTVCVGKNKVTLEIQATGEQLCCAYLSLNKE